MNVYIMNRICDDVLVEPHLQPVPAGNSLVGASPNMLEGACLDVAMNGFWGWRYDRTFIDVRVFNPHADSKTSFSSTYLKHERARNAGCMSKECKRWREHHLSLSYCQLLEAWANKLLYSTNGSSPYCPIKEKLPIVP